MIYGYTTYGGWGGENMMRLFGGRFMMIVFWVLLVIFIVWLVRELRGKNSSLNSSNRALDILNERYAKGEINKEEFESKKKDLN